jgi:hypothetical protein
MSSSILPPELLHIIFEQLTDHLDFYALCLVSKHFYASAIRFLYRRLKIPWGRRRLTAPLHAVLSPAQQESLLGPAHEGELSGCGEFVREFEVRGTDSGEGGAIIEAAVENMSRLESFVCVLRTSLTPILIFLEGNS